MHLLPVARQNIPGQWRGERERERADLNCVGVVHTDWRRSERNPTSANLVRLTYRQFAPLFLNGKVQMEWEAGDKRSGESDPSVSPSCQSAGQIKRQIWGATRTPSRQHQESDNHVVGVKLKVQSDVSYFPIV